MTDDPWAGLLDPGEAVLWQGQPDAAIDWRSVKPMKSVIGLMFAAVGFGLSGATLAGQTASGITALIPLAMGLVFAGVGLQAAIGNILRDGYERSRTWYTLTDRRMIIATTAFGKRRLRDMALTADTALVLEDGTPGTILIDGRSSFGFRRIDDVRHVYGLMRGVQRGEIAEPAE